MTYDLWAPDQWVLDWREVTAVQRPPIMCSAHPPEDVCPWQVSREHCKIDVGPLAVLVTDLGSSKGTRLDSKDGKKVLQKIIMPGQVRCSSALNPSAPPTRSPTCVISLLPL